MEKKKMKMEEDRMSNLPMHLIESILDGMPLRDVVRMSLVSKTWRHIWLTFPKLELDTHFFRENSIPLNRYGYHLILHRILSYHIAPILKFHLFIPYIKPLQAHLVTLDFDCWMHHFSKQDKGLECLTLDNAHQNQPYKPPHSILESPRLKRLKLINCLVRLPHGFLGFPNLEQLFLDNVSFANYSANANTFDQEYLLPEAPRLKTLSLIQCVGTLLLKVRNAPCLQFLSLHYGRRTFYVELSGVFPSLREVEVRTLHNKNYSDNLERVRLINNLNSLIHGITRVETLFLCGFTLELLAANYLYLESRLRYLINLELGDFQPTDLNQIRAALCVISSPNLRSLKIQCTNKDDDVGQKDDVIEYLKGKQKRDRSLKRLGRLQTVKIWIDKLSGVEVFLAKLVLAKMPALESITFQLFEGIKVVESCTLFNQLMSFPRASHATKIICLPPKEKKS